MYEVCSGPEVEGGRPLDLEGIKGKIAELCKRFGIDLFYIFGSYATNNPHESSDVDVAYLAEGKVDEPSLIIGLQEIFEDEGIDLVNLKHASLPLIHRILRDGKCLYFSSAEKRVNFETRAEVLYWDTKWLREEYFRKMLERIENGTFGR